LVIASVTLPAQTPELTIAEARKVIVAGNARWGKARVAIDKKTFEEMLGPDFYAQLQDRRLTRQEFLDRISQNPAGATLTRFDVTVLTVQPTGKSWTAVIAEKLEYDRKRDDGRTEKAYALWVTRDVWQQTGDKWIILSTEALGTERWRAGEKPPFPDWD